MHRYLIFLILFIPISSFSNTVFVTKTGHKYHIENCKYLKISKIKIEIVDAERLGFTPCSVCFINNINTGLNTKNNAFNMALNPSQFTVFVLFISLIFISAIIFYTRLERKKRKQNRNKEFKLSELEQSYLIRMLYQEQTFDTFTLNEFLGLKGKTMDAQRKSRARFIKNLNDKLYLQYNIKDPILRISSIDDKRIICYSINQDHLELLRKEFQPESM